LDWEIADWEIDCSTSQAQNELNDFLRTISNATGALRNQGWLDEPGHHDEDDVCASLTFL
jgi:hypothetical protein